MSPALLANSAFSGVALGAGYSWVAFGADYSLPATLATKLATCCAC